MNKTLKKAFSVILSVVLCMSLFTVASAEVYEPFTFTVDSEGYATLADCDEALAGDIIVPAITIIDGVAYEVKYIGENAFENCQFIRSITISEGIEQIGGFAFLNCTALTDVYIPESLIVCQYTAFNGCGTITAHCYSSNYQFFTVFGIIQNLKLDILDSDGDDLSFIEGTDGIDMTNTIILIVKRVIQMVLYFILNFNTIQPSPEPAPVV